MTTWMIEPITVGRGVNQRASILDYVVEDDAEVHKVGSPLVFTSGIAAQCANDPATVDGFARHAGRNLAADDTAPNLAYFPVIVSGRYRGNLKEALSTVGNGTTVGLLKEGTDWVFSTSVVNKKFKVRFEDTRAAAADTYAIVEVEYTG